MRRMHLLALLAVLAMVFAFGCGGGGANNPVNPVNTGSQDQNREASFLPDEYCGDATIVPLIAGQNINMGQVTVTNDKNYLYVHFTANAPWVITETHVAVSDTLSGIPQTKKNNPIPGQFAYNGDSFIDISQWPCGTELYIAAHAVVEKRGPHGEILESQTAWGKGERFTPKGNWGMYFTYEVQCCFKEPLLPPPGTECGMSISPSTTAYIQTNLWNVPVNVPPYVVYDGAWPGWCVDKYNYIVWNTNYTCQLYSSYNSAAWPADPRITALDWPRINYIINHKQGTPADVQDALWWFSNGIVPPTATGQAMVDEAIANGEDWYPIAGQFMALICYNGPGVQVTFIEVDP